jgi:hypothetical protein
VVAQAVRHRAVRHEGVLLGASVEHGCPRVLQRRRQLGQEPGLADARLAGDEHHDALVAAGAVPEPTQVGELALTPRHRAASPRGREPRR